MTGISCRWFLYMKFNEKWRSETVCSYEVSRRRYRKQVNQAGIRDWLKEWSGFPLVEFAFGRLEKVDASFAEVDRARRELTVLGGNLLFSSLPTGLSLLRARLIVLVLGVHRRLISVLHLLIGFFLQLFHFLFHLLARRPRTGAPRGSGCRCCCR